jgi:hypothetical protein
MTARESVNRPSDLQLGDRVEVWQQSGARVVLDLLLFYAGDWHGVVAEAYPPGLACVGSMVKIYASDYYGKILVRRRSREEQTLASPGEATHG